MITKEIIQKFDKPGPRYTSYPPAPIWEETVNEAVYTEKLKNFGQSQKTLSLYIHIPFCASLCRFCACNVIIRKNDERQGDEYLKHLFKEIDLIKNYIGKKVTIKQLHWGGGTPTFLLTGQIEKLYNKLNEVFDIDREAEIAIEIDPRTIDLDKLQVLRKLGFNRLSMGVQDFDPDVQKIVNRVQSFEIVSRFYHWARDLKFSSINFDLIYGLPKQTRKTFNKTIDKVLELRPDRIALYSFAYVPWLKKHQTTFDKNDLPNRDEKLEIFLQSRQKFIDADYQAIAMDHFALKTDELSLCYKENNLYRNFMGYTVKPADEFIGLGVTAIGYLENTFFQNNKFINGYYHSLEKAILPIARGKVLKKDDLIRQFVINHLMCHFLVQKNELKNKFNIDFDEYFREEKMHLDYCENEGLLYNTLDQIKITELGKIFIRNICMGFDFYLKQKDAQPRFSNTV